MRHHHERQAAVGRHVGEELLQGLEAAGGGAEAHDRNGPWQGRGLPDRRRGPGEFSQAVSFRLFCRGRSGHPWMLFSSSP